MLRVTYMPSPAAARLLTKHSLNTKKTPSNHKQPPSNTRRVRATHTPHHPHTWVMMIGQLMSIPQPGGSATRTVYVKGYVRPNKCTYTYGAYYDSSPRTPREIVLHHPGGKNLWRMRRAPHGTDHGQNAPLLSGRASSVDPVRVCATCARTKMYG